MIKQCFKKTPSLHFVSFILMVVVGITVSFSVVADERPLYQDISAEEKKIRINADELTANSTKNIAKFKGNVRAIRGNMVITCDQLKLYFKQGALAENGNTPGNNSIERILAKTNVKIKMDDRLAFADEAEYLLSSGDIILTGAPVKVSAGNTYITGHRITMAQDGKIIVLPDKGGQVEAMVFPESETSIQ